MAGKVAPNIVTSGLVLYLDAANPESYVSGSTAWNDISRGGNNGTLVNGPTFNNANGGSIVFDGVNDYVSVSDNSSLNIIGNKSVELTVELLSKSVSINPRLFFKYTDSNNQIQVYAPGVNSTRFGVRILDNGVNYDRQMSIIPNINQIYVVSVVFTTGVGPSFYLNGAPVSLFDGLATTLINNRSELFVGTWIENAGFSHSKIFTTKYYNRALSQQEVLQNYNATKTRFGL